jgi:hypothetical protein
MSVPEKNLKFKLSNNFRYSAYAERSGALVSFTSVITKVLVEFPAFITNFTQTFNATWNSETVFGRMDPIATYQGTVRTINLSLTIPARTPNEAKDNMIRCAALTSLVYPEYSHGIIAKPPLIRLRYANWIVGKTMIKKEGKMDTTTLEQGQAHEGEVTVFEDEKIVGASTSTSLGQGLLGWISNLTWNPKLEMGGFEEGTSYYPRVIDMTVSFNVLHENTLSQEKLAKNGWPFGD